MANGKQIQKIHLAREMAWPLHTAEMEHLAVLHWKRESNIPFITVELCRGQNALEIGCSGPYRPVVHVGNDQRPGSYRSHSPEKNARSTLQMTGGQRSRRNTLSNACQLTWSKMPKNWFLCNSMTHRVHIQRGSTGDTTHRGTLWSQGSTDEPNSHPLAKLQTTDVGMKPCPPSWACLGPTGAPT